MPPLYQDGPPQGAQWLGHPAHAGTPGKGAARGADAADVLRGAMGQQGYAMAADVQERARGEDGNYPFGYYPRGDQGAHPGSWVEQQRWNNHHSPGAGYYGWKLDAEKEIPYYPLEFSNARSLMTIPCTPLRVSKRLANSLLWTIFNASQNAVTWIINKYGGWHKGRNLREAETLARVLDLAITEFGVRVVERSAAFEVLIRRLHAVVLADSQKHWEMACLLEELPSAKSPLVHEVIVRDLVTLGKLIDSQGESKKGKTPGLDLDDD